MALPDRILLATDLSARSDRAMDRAMMLAKREGADLVVLHVIEPTQGNRFYPRTESLPALAAIARAQLLHDLGDCADKAQVRIEEGDPAEVIERVARELASTLIIVGVARVERLGRFSLGATVERLVRGTHLPLLVVTDRPRGPYQRVCVAVDFSTVSRETLELATTLFPGQRITAFHAYQPLASYGASDLEQYRAQFRDVADSDFTKWLDGANISAETRGRVVRRLELGSPAQTLRNAAANGDFDLVAIGTRGRGRMFEFFIGSVAKDILAALPCDSLFLREATS
jgi:nucleotide-binding universal stress UspA family protein